MIVLYFKGIGNFWRFPYTVFDNGGGSFFIPYWLCLLFIGIPVLTLEFALGTTFQGNAFHVFHRINSRLSGLGITLSYIAFFVCTYYQCLIALITIYFFKSFQTNLPWVPTTEMKAICSSFSNSDLCNFSASQCRWVQQSAIDEYMCVPNSLLIATGVLNDDVLHETPGAVWPSFLIWPTVGCLFLAYIASYASLFQGTKITGYISMVAVTGPCVLLVVLIVQGMMLNGASTGIRAYLGDWKIKDAFTSANVWAAAASQNIFSIGICQGIMIAYAGHARKGTNPLFSTMISASANHIIELAAGLAVFSVAGRLAILSGYDIRVLPLESLKLVFVAYPVGLSELPLGVSHLFTAMFFLMLWVIGVSSAFAFLKGFACIIDDSQFAVDHRIPKWISLLFSTIIAFFVSLIYCTDTGMAILDVVDFYVTRYLAIAVGFLECATIGFFFLDGRQRRVVGDAACNLLAVSWLVPPVGATCVCFIRKLSSSRNTFIDVTAFAVALVAMVVGVCISMVLGAAHARREASVSTIDSIKLLLWGNIEEFRKYLNFQKNKKLFEDEEQDVPSESESCLASSPELKNIRRLTSLKKADIKESHEGVKNKENRIEEKFTSPSTTLVECGTPHYKGAIKRQTYNKNSAHIASDISMRSDDDISSIMSFHSPPPDNIYSEHHHQTFINSPISRSNQQRQHLDSLSDYEKYYSEANNIVSYGKSRLMIPFIWSLAIKFLCPFVFACLFAASINDFGSYGTSFNFIGVSITLLGFILLISGVIQPKMYRVFKAPYDLLDTSMAIKMRLHENYKDVPIQIIVQGIPGLKMDFQGDTFQSEDSYTNPDAKVIGNQQ